MSETPESAMPPSLYVARVKRALDIVGSVLLLILTSPIQALCAFAVALDDGTPVFYSHPRVGTNGRAFSVHKLRTMTVGTDLLFNDYPTPARVTGVGRVLRRLSLDEIPQLINILRGEMSFVGPRPAIPSQAERYTTEQAGRLCVRPGLTGLAQIKYRDNAPWSRRIATDLEYVRDISFRLDLSIIIRTFPAVLSAKGQMDGSEADIDDLGAAKPDRDRPNVS